MPKVPDFYSVNESKITASLRRYHNNGACAPGRDIPKHEQSLGKGPGTEIYELCGDCVKANADGK